MSSPSAERQEDERDGGDEAAAILKCLDETPTPVNFNVTDFEIKDLPSPLSLCKEDTSQDLVSQEEIPCESNKG